jgi:hypothetical protein
MEQGAEELMEAVVVSPDGREVADEHPRVVCDGGRVLDPREPVEHHRRLGGGGAFDGEGKGSVVVHGDVDEGDLDGVALLQEGVGELHHGREVGGEEARVQNDRLLHDGCFRVTDQQALLRTSWVYVYLEAVLFF